VGYVVYLTQKAGGQSEPDNPIAGERPQMEEAVMIPLARCDYTDACAAADYIRSQIKIAPEVAILTGTGLGDGAPSMSIDAKMDYGEIPHFPQSTVTSHYGCLSTGEITGRGVLLLQGRFHLYEGYQPRQVAFPIRVVQALGIKTLIMSNASGGLNPDFKTGDIMIIEDHINLTGANPLAGPNDDRWGGRFPEMTRAYSGRLQKAALTAARQLEVGVQRGVYAGLAGPSLETPAEIRYLQTIGADAVGFSTVMETITAVHAGMKVLGLSVITNMCVSHALTSTDIEEIIAVAKGAAPHLGGIMTQVLEHLNEDQ
jgi:purine-nucleoside phosphorylase